MPKINQNWSLKGSQSGSKIVRKDVLEAPLHEGGSQVASRIPPGSILERFGGAFGTVVDRFFNLFLVSSGGVV